MKNQYEMPIVEIIDFIALEKLANRQDIEARDGDSPRNVFNPDLSQGYEEW